MDDPIFKIPKLPGQSPTTGEIDAPGFSSTAPANPTLKPAETVPGFNPMAATAPAPSTTGSGGFGAVPFKGADSNLSLMDQATTWNATTGSVSDDERVSEQLMKLLASDSPYVDQARQSARQTANERGLSNSTMALMAGEEAAIRQGLPIAQQDASTYSRQNLTNQAAQNAAGSQNAQMGFQTRQLGEQARQSDNDTGLKAKSLMEQARQFDGSFTEQQRQFDTEAQFKDRTLQEQQRQFDNSELSRLAMFNRETASREQIAALDSATKQYLAKTEAEYKTLMQTSASAAEMWKQYQSSVQSILNNKDLDQPNKQYALDLLYQNLQNGMSVIGYVGSLNLTGLLTFPGAAPAPAPAPGASPGAPPPVPPQPPVGPQPGGGPGIDIPPPWMPRDDLYMQGN